MSHPEPVLHGVAASSLLDPPTLAAHDALVIVGPAPLGELAGSLGTPVAAAMNAAVLCDASLAAPRARPPVVVPAPGVPGGRLVLAPTAPLTEDVDDARAIAEATQAAINRAVEAGARRPLLAVSRPAAARFARAIDVAALAALSTRWAPLEAREADKAPPRATTIGVLGLEEARAKRLSAIELGKALCRDLTFAEPERMTPLRAAALCEEAFLGTGVTVAVERDVSAYPLLAAVARASNQIERHRPAVVTLDYTPAGAVERTVILAGKGVVYDTGGADLKTDGHMAGMSRDKGGAGAVAGLLRAAAELAIPGVRVIGLLGLVRNSAGEDAFVSDEIIRARSGVRVRIGNTDAEGRLLLADLLAAAKQMAAGAPDPLLLSVATLTGHVYRAHGPYTGAIGNSAAASALDALDALGELWAEPMERSRPRREDYTMVAARTAAEDVLSANRLASVNTPRGHQFPFAFLDVASGIKGSGLPLIHLDIGGTVAEGADWQFGRPTAVPVATLVAYLSRGE